MYTYSNRDSTRDKSVYLKGRWIGKVVGDTFNKTISSNNILHSPYTAIANSLSVLNDAEALGAKYCKVFVRDTGQTYLAKVKDIREKGERFGNSEDPQIKLALSEWKRVG
jgi:hypothetical protein